MTDNQTAEQNSQSFSNAFFGALEAALTESCGTQWTNAAEPDGGSTADGSEPVRLNFLLGGTLRGEFVLEFRRAEAVLVASKLLQVAVDEFGAEQSDALMSLVDTAAIKFRSSLENEYGTFTIEASYASESPSGQAHTRQFAAGDEGEERVSVSMYFNPELAESLVLHSRAVSSVAGARKAMKAAGGTAAQEPVNLDLVMDVELNVTLRFGQRQLTLREVMDLASGSVVELDRQVEEPVELLLNGMVIARGEAVVIDGNYGLRVTEVSQPVSSFTIH